MASLGGFFKGLGKGLLKAAPIATAFIPGVGPIASAAIAGGTRALDKKLSGGSWGDAALSGGLGAGFGYGLDKAMGPTSFIQRDINKVANSGQLGGGFLGGLGRALKNPAVMGLGGLALGGMLGSGGGGGGDMGQDNGPGNTGGWRPSFGYGGDMANPNLYPSIYRGREEALANQPWRALGAPGNAGLGISPTSLPSYPPQPKAVDRPQRGARR